MRAKPHTPAIHAVRIPNEANEGISCWRGERTDYVDHHPPRLCPRGMYCVNGSEYDCEAGKYSPVLGIASKSNCSDCLAGMYNPIPAQPFCPFSCPPGKYSNDIGAIKDTCVECEAGKFCHGGMQQPQDCPAGTYRSSTGVQLFRLAKNAELTNTLKISVLICQQYAKNVQTVVSLLQVLPPNLNARKQKLALQAKECAMVYVEHARRARKATKVVARCAPLAGLRANMAGVIARNARR